MNRRLFVRNLLIAIAIGLILLSARIFFGTASAAMNVTIENLPVTSIKDGTYRGEAHLEPVVATVDVKVSGGRITDIRIVEHRNGLGGKAEGPVIKQILETQKMDVDTVSYATISSKAIMKAVENAIRNGGAAQ